ncbi:hypothetical protein [Kitasatospora sp. NPDC005751]|uniref:hypothetical protein n=1 Tax=Kitasatospora sp. NPDC005751 TaxID=3157064 RepID=UPI0033F95CD5
MKTWTELPAETDVEAVVRRYFGLLRFGRISEAEQLVEHAPVRHVLTSLWAGARETGAEEAGAGRGPAADAWERDLSWLGDLDLADFSWGPTGSHLYVELTCRGRRIGLALGFWVRPTDTGWVLTGPATLW